MQWVVGEALRTRRSYAHFSQRNTKFTANSSVLRTHDTAAARCERKGGADGGGEGGRAVRR